QELANAVSHLTLQTARATALRRRRLCRSATGAFARWRRDERRVSTRLCCLGLEGRSRSAHLAKMDKPLRLQVRLLDSRQLPRSPLRRCFKTRPPLRAEYAGFASGCRS